LTLPVFKTTQWCLCLFFIAGPLIDKNNNAEYQVFISAKLWGASVMVGHTWLDINSWT
jgi:hypothetical protein